MSTVAITGAGGYIARQLILSLENQKWCRKILGTDIVEPGVQAGKLEFRNQDIRDPLLFDHWKDQGIDTMVHLAFIVNPIHDEKNSKNFAALIQRFNLVAVAFAYQNR